MRLALMLLALMAGPLAGQPALIDTKAIQTRFGLVAIAPASQFEETVTVNGQRVPGLVNRWVSIKGAFARGDEQHDWVLVSLAHGGNMCPEEFALIYVGAAGVVTTPPFGSCTEGVLDLRVDPGAVTVDLASPELSVARVAFRFDGRSFTETEVPAEVGATPAGAGAQVTRWVGQHPARPFDDPGEKARFGAVMGMEWLEQLHRRLGPANPAFREGDWVIGMGCMPHQCNAERAVWAIRVSDGRPMAAIQGLRTGVQLFGGPLQDLPPGARAFLARPW